MILRKTTLIAGICALMSTTYSPNLMAEKTFSFPPAVQQSRKITGEIHDASGALIGATIKEKGTTNGVVTDLDGNFTINIKPGATLIISYVGYKTREIAAGNQSHFSIELKEEGHNLNDVVVIGYGTQRREAVTGSVANVRGDVLNEVAAPDAARALQGRVAGVLMTQTSSQPGAEMQIRIRGQRSLNASNDPLIVLNGIPFMGQLSDINPADIKSMDILKDASATAIYGSRGANGVIIITSGNGKMEAPATVSYNAYFGYKKIFHKYPMMNGKEFSQLRKDAGMFQNTVDESDDVNTDWQDLFFKTGITTSHDISVAGGNKGGSYSFGGGYYHDGGVVPTQGFTRISLHGNLDQIVGKWFRFGLTTNNSYRETTGTQLSIYNVLSMSPLASPYDDKGNLKRTINMPNDNMYVLTKDVVDNLKNVWLDENKGFGSYNTVYAEVKCPWVDGLKYRVNVGLNYRSNKEGTFTGTGVNSTTATTPNTASVQQDVTRNWAVENIITYDKTFAEKHQINITGLYSAEQTRFERTYMSSKSIPAEYFQYYNIGAADGEISVDPNNQDYWQSGLESWMGRIMYSYDNRYMISAALRADASSRLAKGHQWHTYPAISAGWNIQRENFMKKFTWIDNLKLRVGYGETSNQSISPYSTLGALSIRPYNFGALSNGYARGYYVSTLPNEDLGWEYSSTWNFGLDYSFLNGRINGTFEYYIQNTKDLLLGVALPATTGVSSYTANIGKTRNIGFEFSLNGIILDNHNGWNWSAGVNFYQNRNKLVALASGAKEDVDNRWFVGHPIDVIYDYKKIGLWQKNDPYLDILEPGGNVGMIKVQYTGTYDANGKPTRKIDADDRKITSMEPDLIGGFNTTVGYKNFDLTVIGAFQIGGKLISAIHSANGYLNMLSGRRNNIKVDYYTENNTGAKYPKPGGVMSSDNPKYGSTLGYFNAGYMKIRTITLGYNFDKLKVVKDFGINRLRAYISVENPFVFFSPYKNECGLDPETNTLSNNSGTMAVTMEGYTGAHTLPVVGYNTPATRTFLFGLNITF